MKKLIIVFLVFFTVISMTGAQDLRPIENDISALLEGVGNDILPYLQQTAMAGEGIGRASMGEDSVFFGGLSIGSAFTPGFLTFIDDENSNFELLNVSGLIDDALATAGSDVQSTVDSLLGTFQNIFFLPTLRLNLGVRLPLGIETSLLFAGLPNVLTEAIAGAVGQEGLTLGLLNIGVRVRKVLINDGDGFPAVSVGTGYSFATFNAGFVLTGFDQQFTGYDLNLSGELDLKTTMHTAGIDVIFSKKLAVFYPFLRISPWYQWAKYNGNIGTTENPFIAQFVDTTDDSIIAESQNDPTSEVIIRDLSLIIGAGVEIQLGRFVLVPQGTFDLTTARFTANLSTRVQF